MSAKSFSYTAVLWVAALLCFLPADGLAKEGISRRTRELFDWYDRLGIVEVSRGPFVEVWTGRAAGSVDGKPRSDVLEGFLLSEAPGYFTVIHADLTTQTYWRDGNISPMGRYRKISLEQHIRELLRQARQPDYFKRWTEVSGGRSEQTGRSGQIFVLARECERRGLEPLAEELIRLLASHPAIEGPNGREEPFPKNIRSQLATAATFRAWMLLHDVSNPWDEVAAAFRAIVENCPESENAGPAKETLAMTERLVAEEAKHAASGPKSLEGLAAADKARELVWRLRDVTIDPDTRVPGIAMEGGSKVVDALREMGLEAAPALLAELREPERLSRASNGGNAVSYMLTQELAAGILSGMAGIWFEAFVNTAEPGVRWRKLGEVAEGWWKSCQAGTEQEWLANWVRKGGNLASACARRLHEKYPAAYAEAALQGFRASREGEEADAGRELLRLLPEHREPRVEAALISLLESARDEDRATIALLLQQWKIPEGGEAMRRHWQEAVARGLPPVIGSGPFRGQSLGTLADFLLRSKDILPLVMMSGEARGGVQTLKFLIESDAPQDLRAILDSWPKLPFEYRHFLVELVVRGATDDGFKPAVRSSVAHRVFCQELLLAALEDVRELPEWKVVYANGYFPYPRLCDLAARGLNLRWPDKYAFDFAVSKEARDRQRLRLVNAQRRDLSQPELPMPPVRAPLPPAKVNHVTVVEWDEESVRPGDDVLHRQIAAWKGRPLEADAIVSAIAAYVRKPSAGTARFRVVVSRDVDSTGVAVRLLLAPGQARMPVKSLAKNLVIAGRSLALDATLGGRFVEGFSQDSWSEFKTHVNAALKSPVTKPFAAVAEVSLEE